MIKPSNTLVSEYRYISILDSAVDSDGDGFPEKWQRYLDGMDEPPLKAGEVPTIFTLRHLTSVEIQRVREQVKKNGEEAMAVTACALGLVAAENWTEGKSHVFGRETDTSWLHPMSVVKYSEMALLPPALMTDIGGRVLMAAAPRPN